MGAVGTIIAVVISIILAIAALVFFAWLAGTVGFFVGIFVVAGTAMLLLSMFNLLPLRGLARRLVVGVVVVGLIFIGGAGVHKKYQNYTEKRATKKEGVIKVVSEPKRKVIAWQLTDTITVGCEKAKTIPAPHGISRLEPAEGKVEILQLYKGEIKQRLTREAGDGIQYDLVGSYEKPATSDLVTEWEVRSVGKEPAKVKLYVGRIRL